MARQALLEAVRRPRGRVSGPASRWPSCGRGALACPDVGRVGSVADAVAEEHVQCAVSVSGTRLVANESYRPFVLIAAFELSCCPERPCCSR